MAATRQKISKSCDVCRAKKLKCDSCQVCSYCRKHGLACIYSLVSKPGLKPGYGKDVMRRLVILEEQGRDHGKRLDRMEYVLSSPSSSQGIAQLPPRSSDQEMPQGGAIGLHSQLPSISGQLPSIAELISSQPQPQQAPVAQSDQLPFYPGLPSIGTVRKLMDIFFQRIFPIFPIIHPFYTRQTVERYIKYLLAGQARDPPVIVFAILLNTLQYSADLSSSQKEEYIKRCSEKIILQCYAVASIPQLQAITLMAFHRVNIGNGIESWSVIGIAATGVISLNMSDIRQRIPTLPSKNGRSASSTGSTPSTSSTLIRTKRAKVLKEPIDWLDEQDRKRLVWGIAMLDVFSSFSSGTPLRIPISEIEFSSPFSTSIWMDGKRGSVLPQASLTADAFTYYTQIIKVFRGVHSFLAQPRDISDKSAVGEWFVSFHQIETEIREWKDALPKKYRLLLDSNVLDVSGSGTELPVLVLLHSAYNLALIKMHSSYGYPHVESYVFRHSEQSKRICLSSVANITALVNQIVKERSELIEYLGFHYGFCIWVCSRLLIVNSIFEQKDGNMVDKNDMNEKLTLFSNILKRIGKNSPACQKHHKILKQLINLNMSVSNMIESEDDEQIAPSQAIADMRIHTDLLTLILTNKLSELEPGSVNPSATDLQGLAMRYNLNDMSQENMLLEGFQFDAKSDGFEDLFGYLDSNTKY